MRRRERQIWTPAECLTALREWRDIYGDDPPRKSEWDHRRDPATQPAGSTIAQKLGGWSNAMRKAGFTPRGRGWSSHIDPAKRFGKDPLV